MKRYVPPHLNKQNRREARWAQRDLLDEISESEEAVNNLLHKGGKLNKNSFDKELSKVEKAPISKEQAKLRLRHEWEVSTGKEHLRRKAKVDKFKREILTSAFKRVALTLTDEQRFIMLNDLEKKTKPSEKRDVKFITSRSKSWEVAKISKILDHISKRLSKEEKKHLAPNFFERVKESLLGDVWTLSNLEEMILLDVFHAAVRNFNEKDSQKLASLKTQKEVLNLAKETLHERRKKVPKLEKVSGKKDVKTISNEYKKVKKAETKHLQKNRTSSKTAKSTVKKDLRSTGFATDKTVKKQTAKETKKIAKRAIVKERKARVPGLLTSEQKHHKLEKRVAFTRSNSAKFVATKHAGRGPNKIK